ncbi:hypothetical protein [Aeromonas veronii]|uniref:hypothetical protein n=1 Tax=Aeromonas veronii TaxID=654 RepID=UPI003F794328
MALSEKQMVMNIKGRINDELVPLKERITGLERASSTLIKSSLKVSACDTVAS